MGKIRVLCPVKTVLFAARNFLLIVILLWLGLRESAVDEAGQLLPGNLECVQIA